jgi:deoxyribose-phosphate aldolase
MDYQEIKILLESASLEAKLPDGRYEKLRQVMGFLDLTTLEGTDNPARIEQLCRKALSFAGQGLPLPAAVCVYPPFVRQAKNLLSGTPVKVASVAGAFPSGQLPLHLKVAEVRYAVEEGADEIDMVISRGTFLAGGVEEVGDEIRSIREACRDAHLKVILETGELGTPEHIHAASVIAISSGAHFIKTSTGKIQPAAAPESMAVMLVAIREHFEATGRKVGIKPAGGISTPDQALLYRSLVEQVPGVAWLTPGLFRIGASRLADAIAAELLS